MLALTLVAFLPLTNSSVPRWRVFKLELRALFSPAPPRALEQCFYCEGRGSIAATEVIADNFGALARGPHVEVCPECNGSRYAEPIKRAATPLAVLAPTVDGAGDGIPF